MRKYEIMYIVNSSLDEEARQAVIEGLHGIITSNGGNIVNIDDWGMRTFAYEIKFMQKGYYMVVTFEADNNVISELDRLTRINPNIVRHMIINLDEVK